MQCQLKFANVCSCMRQTCDPLQPLSPPCRDRRDQAGRVFECLFTSSPRQFSPSLYRALQQEQMIKIEPPPPALPNPLAGNVEGEQGVREGGKEMKRGNTLFMEKGNGAGLRALIETRGGRQGWSSGVKFVYGATRQLFSKTTFHGCIAIKPMTGSPRAKTKPSISGASRTCRVTFTRLWSLFEFNVAIFTSEICVIIFCYAHNITIRGFVEYATFPDNKISLVKCVFAVAAAQ